MADPDARTEQVTRIGAPAAQRQPFRLGVAAWAGMIALAAGAGAGAQLLHDEPAPKRAPAPVGESALVRGDLDQDKLADLVVSTPEEILGFTSTGTGFRESGFRAESAEDALRGDVDGDGRTDLLTVVPAQESLDVVLRRSGAGGFAAPRRFRVEGIGRGDRLVLGDVDGDGDEDLIGAGEAGALVALADEGAFQVARQWSDDLELREDAIVLAGMFTDDDRADLLVIDGPDEGVELEVLPSDGKAFGSAELWRDIPDWSVSEMRAMIGDFDGDGRTDLAELGRPDEGGLDVMVLRSRGVDFGPPSQWLLEPDLEWTRTRVVAGDYDGDGMADVALLQPGANGTTDVVVRRSTGTGLSPTATWLTGEWPGNPRPVGVGAGALGVR